MVEPQKSQNQLHPPTYLPRLMLRLSQSIFWVWLKTFCTSVSDYSIFSIVFMDFDRNSLISPPAFTLTLSNPFFFSFLFFSSYFYSRLTLAQGSGGCTFSSQTHDLTSLVRLARLPWLLMISLLLRGSWVQAYSCWLPLRRECHYWK